jgi:hypothetical protein
MNGIGSREIVGDVHVLTVKRVETNKVEVSGR